MASINSKAFEALLRTGEYSDFTITCHGTEFKVHKNILGTGSGFFKALFRNECQVSDMIGFRRLRDKSL